MGWLYQRDGEVPHVHIPHPLRLLSDFREILRHGSQGFHPEYFSLIKTASDIPGFHVKEGESQPHRLSSDLHTHLHTHANIHTHTHIPI